MEIILVTGAKGAVGRPLVEELRSRGHEVWLSDIGHSSESQYIRCDLSKYQQVQRTLQKRDFSFVYHLGAEFGRNNGEDFYENLWSSNVIGMKHIIRMQAELGFRMIFSSSSEIYGDYEGKMMEDVPLKHPIRQLNDYAISKWVNELQIINCAERFQTESVRLRLFNTYGPGEYFSEYRSVIYQFIYKSLARRPYKVFLNHHRTSTYIDEVIRTMANVVDHFIPGEVYNICGDEYHNIKELSDMILAEVGIDDSLVEYVEFEPHNVRNKMGDNTKAKHHLGHTCTVALKEGIRRTVEWQKSIYEF